MNADKPTPADMQAVTDVRSASGNDLATVLVLAAWPAFPPTPVMNVHTNMAKKVNVDAVDCSGASPPIYMERRPKYPVNSRNDASDNGILGPRRSMSLPQNGPAE